MRHEFGLRVYYEDTDLAGVVYHANYFRFTERARTEFVRTLGIDQGELKTDYGLVLMVTEISARFVAPARFDDILKVVTEPRNCTGVRATLRQDVCRDDTLLFSSDVILACVRLDGRPVRMPAEIRSAFQGLG